MLETDDGVRVKKAFSLDDVVGRAIVCDDGVTRRVQQICHSLRYPDRLLVNEIDEDETPGGAWVHALSLACQMHGNPVPTKEQMQAASRYWGAHRFVPDNKPLTTPSGIHLLKN